MIFIDDLLSGQGVAAQSGRMNSLVCMEACSVKPIQTRSQSSESVDVEACSSLMPCERDTFDLLLKGQAP